VADRDDDQTPGQTGPAGDDTAGSARAACRECGTPLALDQRYCIACGARRGILPGAVAGTVAPLSSKGKAAAAVAGKAANGKGGGDGGWSWMPSPPAIAIAVIGMLALGVGLGSAMSEIASSAPLQTILLEYPHHATEAAPAEEPEEEFAESEPELAEAPEEEEAVEEVVEEAPLPEEIVEEAPLPEEASSEVPPPVEFNPLEEPEGVEELTEVPLPEIKHAFLIVLGEGGYDETFGAAAGAPYLSRVLPKKGELLPNYYGVTSGVLANEIALLSGQGPTPETAANCPNYTAIAPGTVSVFGEQVEGDGCVYGEEVKSLPTQLTEKELTWRAYVEDIEKGAEAGQPTSCRKPTLGGPDTSPTPVPGDQYATWRNPVVYFSAIAESPECGKLDVGFEALTRDLEAKKKTPALSLIFPDACHAGGELECEPGAPKGAQGVAALLKTLVPAIMASPAYAEGGIIMITSAQAPQAGEHLDSKACCLAPEYPNLAPLQPTAPTPSTTGSSTAEPEAVESPFGETTTYTEESVLEAGGGGKVGLLMISPYVEAGKVEEAEYANHFTLLKTLATMLGVEPTGYATEEEMPALNGELFKTAEEVEAEEKAAVKKSPRSAGGPPARAVPRRGAS
jgi:hypothetical protein